MRYFEQFELIRYGNSTAINITQRAAILSAASNNRFAFYPYQVKNGMRAEQVAEKYYGNADLVWLVYFSNNIVDPYHEWTMDEDTFNNHLISQYGSIQAARTKIVKYRVNWYEDTTQLSRAQYDALPQAKKKYWTPKFDVNNYPIHYIRKEIDFISNAQDAAGNVTLSVPAGEAQYWSAVTAYDQEEEANAKKAQIRLLDSRLAPTAESNLKELLGQ